MSKYTETQLFEAMLEHLGKDDLPKLCLYLRNNKTLKDLYYEDLPEGRQQAILYMLPYCSRRNALGTLEDILQREFGWVFEGTQPNTQAGLSDDSRIPTYIRDDLNEAMLCLNAGALRATVVMCRRTLESAFIGKGARPSFLSRQIQELASNNLLTKDLIQWADKIRIAGNDAIHPTGVAVGREDAENITKLTEQFLFYLYVGPAVMQEEWERHNKSKP